MKHQARRHEDAFYVRIWVESLERPNEWRGMVIHVGTAERQYFTTFSDLLAFLESRRVIALDVG